MVESLVIIGSGPAGYTAAIYAGRAQLKPVVFEGFEAGGVPGGQLMTTTEVENFPGFPEGIQGPKLMHRMRQQALRWGAQLITDDVIEVNFQHPFTVRSTEQVVHTHAVIISTGATAKRLHLPGEETFWNNGISACAICDGASPLFKDTEVAVVGGGDSAAEEALYLTKYARKVHLLVRRDRLRASKTMQDRLLNHHQLQVHWNCMPLSTHGDEVLRWIRVQDTQTGAVSELAINGLFYAIGHTPNTQLFQGQVKFVAPHCPSCETLAPVLQQLVTDHAGKLHLVTIDMTQDPVFAMELGVRSAPTVVLFQGTKVLERIAGLKPKKLYADAVQKVLSALQGYSPASQQHADLLQGCDRALDQ